MRQRLERERIPRTRPTGPAALYASRNVFTVPISFGVQTEVWQPFDQAIEKFIGPTFAISYSAGDSTAYAGAQRTFAFSLRRLGVSPLPGKRARHARLPRRGAAWRFRSRSRSGTASWSVRQAARCRVRPRVRCASVATSSLTTLISNGRSDPFPAGPGIFLPGTLVEGLRGFDDFALRAQYVAIFNGRYRYSFIIDRGFASLLYIFPSIFFRQLDLEGFGAAAITEIAGGAQRRRGDLLPHHRWAAWCPSRSRTSSPGASTSGCPRCM